MQLNKSNYFQLKIVSLIITFIFFTWFLYRYLTHFPEFIDELFFKPLIWIFPIILVLIWKKISLQQLRLSVPNVKLILFSLATGLGLSLLQILPHLINSNLQFTTPMLNLNMTYAINYLNC